MIDPAPRRSDPNPSETRLDAESSEALRDSDLDAWRPGDLPPPPRPLPGAVRDEVARWLAGPSATTCPVDRARPVVEGYEILDRLDWGGTSVVYLARQAKLGRLVALKFLAPGRPLDPVVVARFHAEAEAIARLGHPNIVQIHDVASADGELYLALEYVEGGSLARQLDAGPPRLRDGARLVEILARAVDFAHEQGVVHRDIKPGNILLTADGIPKLTDFGLARRLDTGESPTRVGDVLGTPSYMAPEQAMGEVAGPLADVHGLGATLYELITGRPPFHGETPLDTLRLARSVDPMPPSRLRAGVPRDLETICLKCLEKEPGRRYASASALADDLRRFLAGESIHARAVGHGERLAKWLRRHPTPGALAAVSAISVAALTLGALVHARALNAAWLRERALAVRAESLRLRAEARRTEAEANLDLLRDAIDRFHTRVSENRLFDEPGMEPLRRELLESARDLYGALAARRGTEDAEAEAALARAHGRLARLQQETESAPKARATLAVALEIQERLASGPNAGWESRGDLANSLQLLGILDRALGQLESAESSLRRAQRLDEQLARERPRDPSPVRELVVVLSQLGQVYETSRDLDHAEEVYRQALDVCERLDRDQPGIAENRRALAVALNNLGALGRARGRLDEAETLLVRSLEIRRGLANDHPTSTNLRRDLAIGYNNLGNLRRAAGRADEAEAAYRESLALRDRLAAERPSIAKFQGDLASTLNNLGVFYHSTNRTRQAEAAWEHARAIRQALVDQHAEVPEYRAALANTWHNLALLHRSTNRLDLARQAFSQALQLDEQLVAAHPRIFGYRADLGENLVGLGDLDVLEYQSTSALKWYDRASRLLAGAPGTGGDRSRFRMLALLVQIGRARALTRLDQDDEALDAWARAGRLAASGGPASSLLGEQRVIQLGRALTLARADQADRALDALARVAAESPLTPAQWFDAACVHATVASRRAAGSENAEEAVERALACLRRALASDGFRTSALTIQLWTTPALDPLRSRDAFQKLALDLGFPGDPFAP